MVCMCLLLYSKRKNTIFTANVTDDFIRKINEQLARSNEIVQYSRNKMHRNSFTFN
jgi:hypothetical protein